MKRKRKPLSEWKRELERIRNRQRYAEQKAVRVGVPVAFVKNGWEPTRFVTLPTVSILNTDDDLTPADFQWGNRARREAGL